MNVRRLALACLCALAFAVVAAAPAAAGHVPFLPIGEVQGAVADEDDGLGHRSPYAGAVVTVRGVITEKTLTGTGFRGFFLESTAETADGNAHTSDGIFVFHGRFRTLLREGGGFYTPTVGDDVVLRGRVVEFFQLTELENPRLVEVAGGAPLPAPFEADPPDDLAEANRYWERREGMRARIAPGSIATGKRDVFASSGDGELWLVRGDHPVARRPDPYARRVFRDPHPLDNVPAALFDDGNGYRIVLGSNGIKEAANDASALIAPARTFDTVVNAPAGGVYFSFGKYQVMVAEQPLLLPGADPAANAPPEEFVRAREYSVATFNVENLYDFRDDPFDGCDFAGNAGCPGVRPPFDYVPESEQAYERRLAELAHQLVADAKAPDLVLVQEAEDQDVCTVAAGALACGAVNDRDGRPDTLQELALAIAASGGPRYAAAYDRDGADDRGIVSAFLYRTDRVQLLPARANDPVLGSSPEVDYRGAPKPYNGEVENPKALNAALPADVDRSTGTDGEDVFTRAPQVGLFRLWRVGVRRGSFLHLYAVSNHFSSTPDRRVGQRREQAAYNAAIVRALEEEDRDVRALVGGDVNVFPRPDDPFFPGHPLFPSDQLAPLYEQGLENLYDVLAAEAPASAYTYVFQGQAQTLDQLFVTDSLFPKLEAVRVAHVNADWPSDYAEDGARGASDHDPVVARFKHEPTRGGPAAVGETPRHGRP